MGLLTASVRELTNARALDVGLVDTNGDPITLLPVSVVSTALGLATLTSVASSATDVVVVAANLARRKFHIYNDSKRTLKLAYGVVASATVFTLLLPAQSSYESSLGDYAGAIHGIWNSANGFARVTEITPGTE